MNTKKIITLLLAIVLVVAISFTAVACTNTSLEDKIDDILNQLSELRKEMEAQQGAIAELVGANNVDIIFVSPSKKLENYSVAPKQSIEGNYEKITVKYDDVVTFTGEVTIHQEDVLKYLVNEGKITCITSPAVGVEEIKITGTTYELKAASGNYIFGFTTVPKFCPPSPSLYDYSFKYDKFEVFSAYDTIANTLVTKGSVMAFGYVIF